jgi:hypothetical protein
MPAGEQDGGRDSEKEDRAQDEGAPEVHLSAADYSRASGSAVIGQAMPGAITPNDPGPRPVFSDVHVGRCASPRGTPAFSGAAITGAVASFEGNSAFRGVGAIGRAAGFSPAITSPAAFSPAGFELESADEEEEQIDGVGNVLDPPPPSGQLEFTGFAPNVEVHEVLNANDSVDAEVIPGNVLFAIDRAAQELEAARVFLQGIQAQRGAYPSNNPPGFLDGPDFDIASEIEDIEAAAQCLTVLRRVIIQPEPDLSLLLLLWRVVRLGLRVVSKVISWAGRTTKAIWDGFVGSVFGGSFVKALGTTLGAGMGAVILTEIAAHGPVGLQRVELFLKSALAAHGVHLPQSIATQIFRGEMNGPGGVH